ncbi:hypothetical protein Avbf_11487 [Armadillidium vulgare]|nr:hypothetical protein Avbf_11487 [Armadillidium vulgare]
MKDTFKSSLLIIYICIMYMKDTFKSYLLIIYSMYNVYERSYIYQFFFDNLQYFADNSQYV